MEIKGNILEILPEKTGTSDKGDWRKQEYILETEGQYPKKICFMLWNDKIDQTNIKQGENLVVSVDIESREYNGRWYTDIKAWKVTKTLEVRNEVNSDKLGNAYGDLNASPDTESEEIIPFNLRLKFVGLRQLFHRTKNND